MPPRRRRRGVRRGTRLQAHAAGPRDAPAEAAARQRVARRAAAAAAAGSHVVFGSTISSGPGASSAMTWRPRAGRLWPDASTSRSVARGLRGERGR
ncbi:hypothetical protein MNEG_7967, partial [Monoraphidium neglectum]